MENEEKVYLAAQICPECIGHLWVGDSGEPELEPGLRCEDCGFFISDFELEEILDHS